jgi:hypothetical protein
LALFSSILRSAKAVSRVFLKCTRRCAPRACVRAWCGEVGGGVVRCGARQLSFCYATAVQAAQPRCAAAGAAGAAGVAGNGGCPLPHDALPPAQPSAVCCTCAHTPLLFRAQATLLKVFKVPAITPGVLHSPPGAPGHGSMRCSWLTASRCRRRGMMAAVAAAGAGGAGQRPQRPVGAHTTP